MTQGYPYYEYIYSSHLFLQTNLCEFHFLKTSHQTKWMTAIPSFSHVKPLKQKNKNDIYIIYML